MRGKNNNKQFDRSSAVNEPAEQAHNNIKTTDEPLLNKQQELKELEYLLSQKEKDIDQKEQELRTAKEAIAKKEAELNNKRVQLEEKELQAKNGFPQLLEEKFSAFKKQLDQREAQCVSELKSLEADKEKLRQRAVALQQAENQRDNGYADDRAKLDDELSAKRKNLDDELRVKRETRYNDLEIEIEYDRDNRLKLLSSEIDTKRSDFENKVAQQRSDLKAKEEALFKREQAVEDLEFEKEKTKRKQDRLEEERNTIKEEIEQGILERKQSFESEKSALNDEIVRLRESIKTSNALISNFEELKHKLGDEDPAAVLLKLKTYEEEIKKLRDDLATRPTQEMREAFDRLQCEKVKIERERDNYKEDYQGIFSSQKDQSELETKIDSLERLNKSLSEQRDNIEAHNNQLQSDIKRLQSSYEREADREARVRDIEAPYIQKKLPRAVNNVCEIQWLDLISKSCIDYGLRFSKRILYAYHTALKTSEWSPITVLAGVSGTGKSELPRLYSHFGGINFLNLSVQPNWDSQESMLGFFNSIDNKFDAQPVLRLLAQSQKPQSDDYPGLEDVMSLILMDEMNLAHVELYFAEFLSKLEMRRGMKKDLPFLDVKLGAGIESYQLPMGRNVLWAGTMNQDETTKSLSDKVLDRGIVINFPRPSTLERRRQLKPLGDQAHLLSRKLWESWWCRESIFTDDQILPFKGFIEEMNDSLSKVGRALGHRVWQSIEYYMANYPDVLEAQRNKDDTVLAKAMKIAFEDQLVQKVMPKLRGIETRGKSKSDCLDKIKAQLINDDYAIVEDFELACEFGYGQFIWNSANYLKDDELVNDQKNKEIEESKSVSNTQMEYQNNPETTSNEIPEELKEYAKKNKKNLWQLTTKEIMETMRCDAKEAKSYKDLCNETKES
ncbi:chromosome partitioning protein ParA [Shewanella baltica]|uniref:chromosome partitioning protein ParA n=1 Tax=Shewanella baltica TaxID=62322 RepID=UPI00217EFD2C|nr:chromosome partitioning protein ParA [Shewanella baltica]MCS6210412.1 chromosome partitioning protein ParA [Shewanella baltica]